MIDPVFLYPAEFLSAASFLFWPALVVFVLWLLMHRDEYGSFTSTSPDSLFQVKISPGSSFIVIILLLALVGLAERFLYDLTRNQLGVGANYFGAYFDNLSIIMIHSLVILIVLVISFVVNVLVAEKRQRYAVVLIPYFVTSAALVMQLMIQISIFFYNNHTRPQLYVVLIGLVALSSAGIYLIQDRYTTHFLGGK